MIMNRVGAPEGGRVHWLLWALRGEFMKTYTCDFNYMFHNYRFVRYKEYRLSKVIDEFIVIRTSKKCWRVMYYNHEKQIFKYLSADTYRECASRILEIYTQNKNL